MCRENIVRAVAGIMVLASVGLGIFVNEAFFYLTLFVGFNLLQSSFTKFCPLELILKKCNIGSAS